MPTYLPACLPPCLPGRVPVLLPACLVSCVAASLHACLSRCLPACLVAGLVPCLPRRLAAAPSSNLARIASISDWRASSSASTSASPALLSVPTPGPSSSPAPSADPLSGYRRLVIYRPVVAGDVVPCDAALCLVTARHLPERRPRRTGVRRRVHTQCGHGHDGSKRFGDEGQVEQQQQLPLLVAVVCRTPCRDERRPVGRLPSGSGGPPADHQPGRLPRPLPQAEVECPRAEGRRYRPPRPTRTRAGSSVSPARRRATSDGQRDRPPRPVRTRAVSSCRRP